MVRVTALALLPAGACSDMNVSAIGRQAPSPKPAGSRRGVEVLTFGARATAIVNTETHAMQAIRVRRRPNRSVTGPISAAPMPTPTRPTGEAVGGQASGKPRSADLLSVGITAPITTRSKPSSATASQHRTTGQSPPADGVRRPEVGAWVETDMTE